MECQHFLDCINNGTMPLSDGRDGMELVKILEAASASLKLQGAPINFTEIQKSHSTSTRNRLEKQIPITSNDDALQRK